MKDKRAYNIDLLRVIACTFVIMLHVGSIYLGDDYNFNFIIGNFFDSFGIIAVPLFVMISGYFIIGNDKNLDFKYFYSKTLKNIVIPTIIWSLIYLLYSELITILSMVANNNFNSSNLLNPLVALFKGVPYYHMWYMYMIIGLYLLAPLIIRIKNEISPKSFKNLGFIFLFIGFISELTNELFWNVKCIEFIGYFMFGYIIKTYSEKIKVKKEIFIGLFLLSFIAIFISTNLLCKYKIGDNTLYFYQNLSPFVILGSLSFFTIFINIKNTKDNILIDKLAKHSFTIYILHAGIINIIEILISTFNLAFNPVLFIPLCVIFTLITSYILSVLISCILKLNFIKNLKLKLYKKIDVIFKYQA